jgi:hypothetical protein
LTTDDGDSDLVLVVNRPQSLVGFGPISVGVIDSDTGSAVSAARTDGVAQEVGSSSEVVDDHAADPADSILPHGGAPDPGGAGGPRHSPAAGARGRGMRSPD